MQVTPHYVVYTIPPASEMLAFGDIGVSHGSEPCQFADACDRFATLMNAGCESVVFRVDPPIGGDCGMMIDATEDALDTIRHRLKLRGHGADKWPAWLQHETAA